MTIIFIFFRKKQIHTYVGLLNKRNVRNLELFKMKEKKHASNNTWQSFYNTTGDV